MTAVYILWLRQVKKYMRSRARMIGSLGQPVLFLVAFGFGFGPIFEKAGAGNYLAFMAPGIIIMGIMMTAVFSGIELIFDKQFGFLKETMVAPVSRFSIMFGRTTGSATVALFQGVFTCLIALLVGFHVTSISGALGAILVGFVAALLFASFGTIVALNVADMSAFPLIMNLVVMPLFFLSGALFPIAGLPTAIRVISQLNPVSYAVDLMRWSLTGMGHLSVYIDISVLVIVAGVLLAIGSVLFSRLEL